MIPALKDALTKASLLTPEASLLAAVSGGSDSLALLYGLTLLRNEVGFHLYAVHVEHGLRGKSALEDAAFVEEFCQARHVPLFLYHAELTGAMDSPGAEARAREARRHFFHEAMAACQGNALLTAHHQDDQAETVLMHLLRGAGSKGLGGIRPTLPFGSGLLLRPFLDIPGVYLSNALIQADQVWQKDETNEEPCCLRNRLRLGIFPSLNALQPQAATHIAQAAKKLQWDEDCLSQLADQLLRSARQPWPIGNAVNKEPLRNAPKAIALRALRLWFSVENTTQEHSLSYEDSLELYALLLETSGKSINLPGNLRVTSSETHLHLEKQTEAVPDPPSLFQPLSSQISDYSLGAHFHFTLTPFDPADELPDGRKSLILSEPLLLAGLSLRTSAPDDRILPFGAAGHKPLRRYFSDHKVPLPFRSAWPVLATNNNIFWVPGIGAAEKTRLRTPLSLPLWRLTILSPLPPSCEK